MGAKIWFITGTSRGFGRIWAEAALARGDKVVATARKLDAVSDLAAKYKDAVLPLALDVTKRADVFAAVAKAHKHFGRLDVVINNAGYGQFGALEEVSEADARAQIETNVFGPLWVTQAVLPFLRQQRSGHLIAVSSVGGITTFPSLSLYHTSKWALEGMNETLAQEVGEFGIKITLVEPGGYATDWGGSSAGQSRPMPEYDGVRKKLAEAFKGAKIPDPKATAPAILKLVDAQEPPLRLFLGSFGLQLAKKRYAERLATWEKWAAVADSAE